METKLSLYLRGTESFFSDFKTLCELTKDQLQLFTETFKSEDKYDFSDAKITSLLKKVEIDSQNLVSATSVAKFIYKKILDSDLSKEDIVIELKALAEKSKAKLQGSKLSLLTEFFIIPAPLKLKHNKLPYRNSVIPLLSTCTSLHDLRAMWDDKDDIKDDKNINNVTSFIPMAIIRIIAEDDKEQTESLDFQTDIEGLETLIAILEESKKKLKSLEEKAQKLIE